MSNESGCSSKICHRCGEDHLLSDYGKTRVGGLRKVCRHCCSVAISNGWWDRTEQFLILGIYDKKGAK